MPEPITPQVQAVIEANAEQARRIFALRPDVEHVTLRMPDGSPLVVHRGTYRDGYAADVTIVRSLGGA